MNKSGKIIVAAILIAAVVIVIAFKQNNKAVAESDVAVNSFTSVPKQTQEAKTAKFENSKALPRLIDLGADKCIPCKMMAPILENLKKEYTGIFEVDFIDVWKNPDDAKKYGIKIIPTQIFLDGSGKELFRHKGFMGKEDILSKWKELGIKLTLDEPEFSRLAPLVPDTRAAETVCYMCDGDVNPQTCVQFKTDKGQVVLCCPHCYFITYSSILENRGMDEKVSVTDWSTGQSLPAIKAAYLYGVDKSGRPIIKAFTDNEAALKEREINGGNIFDWQILKNKELAVRCGFCDRAIYPEDAALVKADGLHTWGCCPMCALGVAARTQKDIEVFQKDALTGEMVNIKTTNGSVSQLEPETAVAWSGKKKTPEDTLVSAGCFKQAFFTSEENLKKWVGEHPRATGKMVTISQALAAKMKLSQEQISKACKIGECVPK